MQQENDGPERAPATEDGVDSNEIQTVEHEMGDKEDASTEVGESSGNAGTLELEENAENLKAVENEETVEDKEMALNMEATQTAQPPEAMEVVEKSEATETPQPSETPQPIPSEETLATPAPSSSSSPSLLSSEDLTRLVHVKNYENQILLNELERVRQLYSTVPSLALLNDRRVDSNVLESTSSKRRATRSTSSRSSSKSAAANSKRLFVWM